VDVPAFTRRLATVDPAMVLRVAMRVAKRKTVKVKNKETGKIVYKSPAEYRENREKYEKIPQPYDRRPKGRPRKVPDPGNEYLPAPEKIPRPKKPKKIKKPKKLPVPVPQPKVPEPPKPAPKDAPYGLRWKRDDSG
jgi:hypothetical protein